MLKLFVSTGINVWVEDGMVVIADDQEREEYPDTAENRTMCIKKAESIVRDWEESK